MLKELIIQIQPNRARDLKLEEIQAALESISRRASLVRHYRFETGVDKTRYFNFTFETEDLSGLWSLIQTKIYRNPSFAEQMARSSIVVCEGADGWNDYLQLFHFDPTVTCDDLGAI